MVTLTGTLLDAGQGVLDPRRTRVRIESNASTLGAFDAAGHLHLGGEDAAVSADGSFEFTDLVSSADIDGLAYQVLVNYPTVLGKGRADWSSGWFPLTSDTTLAVVASIATPQAVPITSLEASIDTAASNVRADTLTAATNAQDAATAAATSETSAAGSATAAATSSTNAATSASHAADSAAAAAASAAPATSLIRSTVSGDISTDGTDIATRLDARNDGRYVAPLGRSGTGPASPLPWLNIKDFGATGDGTTDDASAILAACAAYPGRAFYFPAGNYCLMSGLTITTGNSLRLHPDARIFAGATMTTLIDWKPDTTDGSTNPSFTELVTGKEIAGGTLDGAMMANTVLKVSQQMRTRISDMTFKNGLLKGLWTDGPGAEVIGTRLSFVNDTAANSSADNVAIFSSASDSHFEDIIIVDWNKGIYDEAAAAWSRAHVWISQPERIAGSVGFHAFGNSHFIQCYADTTQTGWHIAGSSSRVRIMMPVCFWNSFYYPDAVTNPPVALLIDTSATAIVTGGQFWGHPSAATPFASGYTNKLTATGNSFDSQMSGGFDYLAGIPQGVTTFTPTIAGSTTAGSHTYTTQIGEMSVSGRTIVYRVSLKGTLDATLAGSLQVKGFPSFAIGSGGRGGQGSIGYRSGLGIIRSATQPPGATTDVTLWTENASTGSSVAIDAATLQGKAFEISLTLTTYVAP